MYSIPEASSHPGRHTLTLLDGSPGTGAGALAIQGPRRQEGGLSSCRLGVTKKAPSGWVSWYWIMPLAGQGPQYFIFLLARKQLKYIQ